MTYKNFLLLLTLTITIQTLCMDRDDSLLFPKMQAAAQQASFHSHIQQEHPMQEIQSLGIVGESDSYIREVKKTKALQEEIKSLERRIKEEEERRQRLSRNYSEQEHKEKVRALQSILLRVLAMILEKTADCGYDYAFPLSESSSCETGITYTIFSLAKLLAFNEVTLLCMTHLASQQHYGRVYISQNASELEKLIAIMKIGYRNGRTKHHGLALSYLMFNCFKDPSYNRPVDRVMLALIGTILMPAAAAADVSNMLISYIIPPQNTNNPK